MKINQIIFVTIILYMTSFLCTSCSKKYTVEGHVEFEIRAGSILHGPDGIETIEWKDGNIIGIVKCGFHDPLVDGRPNISLNINEKRYEIDEESRSLIVDTLKMDEAKGQLLVEYNPNNRIEAIRVGDGMTISYHALRIKTLNSYRFICNMKKFNSGIVNLKVLNMELFELETLNQELEGTGDWVRKWKDSESTHTMIITKENGSLILNTIDHKGNEEAHEITQTRIDDKIAFKYVDTSLAGYYVIEHNGDLGIYGAYGRIMEVKKAK